MWTRAPGPTVLCDVLVLRLQLDAFPPLRVSMPVHPHFRDLAVLGLAEHRAARVHPFPRAAPPVRAAELRREPRSRHIDLARLERHLGLVDREVLPVSADGVAADAFLAERGLEEDGPGRKHGHDLVHVPALPAAAKRLEQLTIALVHGANIPQSGTRARGVW